MNELSTPDQLVRAFGAEERLAHWQVRQHSESFVEVARGEVIVVLAWPALWRDEAAVAPHLIRARSGNYPLVLLGEPSALDGSDLDRFAASGAFMTAALLPLSVSRLAVVLRGWGDADRTRLEKAELELDLERARYENDLLIDIGRALTQERDLDSLLDLILRRAREVTGADAGSVYVVEGDAEEVSKRTLRFAQSQNESRDVGSEGFTMPVSPSSIVGACVLAGEVIDIPDLYDLDEPGTGNNPWGFVHDKSFDLKHDYQTRSMVTVPMISARDQVIGVIQLINKRDRGVSRLSTAADFEDKVLPFDEVSINYANTLASQAGIALENTLLYDEVKTLFEGFVHASVTAIESRDPTTSGHSERVAELTVGLAQVADRADSGPYAGLVITPDELKQIEYAALLHDFGKVGVRENVLVKPKKLYEHDRALIEARFEFIRRTIEVETLKSKVGYLLEASRDEAAARLEEVDREAAARLAEIDDFIEFILKANEPSVLEQGGFERIAEIAAKSYVGRDGATYPYLTPDEALALQIARGSLTREERAEIESHVVHTFNFLTQIPWGRTYRSIPEIAGAHHEKLDGSGYPRGLASEQIPVPAKMMTISDIYDALTASDRPYKRAVPRQKALDILGYEVEAGKLDADLYQLFLDAEVWKLVEAG